MDVTLLRLDGTYVATINGNPYHVTKTDPLFDLAVKYGESAPLEVILVAVVTIEAIRENAIRAMVDRINEFTAQFTAGVPKDEVASWPTKAAGAEVVLGGGTSAIISAEAATLGVDAMTVATDIATRSAQYEAIIGAVTGVRRSAEAGIAAAGDQAEVDAALDAAMVTAVSIATSMGMEF